MGHDIQDMMVTINEVNWEGSLMDLFKIRIADTDKHVVGEDDFAIMFSNLDEPRVFTSLEAAMAVVSRQGTFRLEVVDLETDEVVAVS